jgi:L-alanine-DL-glutamate epimerase-like enolase superfamily enzyme
MKLEWSAYTVPTDAPEADGTLAWDSTTILVVRVHEGDHTGLGWSYTAAAAGHLLDEVLAPHVTADPERSYTAMVRAVRNLGRAGLAATAISAVDVALWDLRARQVGVRLATLLGPARDTVPVYGSGGFTTYDDAELEAQLRGWIDQGIPRMKIKIGESWGAVQDRDLRRVAHARTVVGPDCELYVDANGGYTRKQAIRVGRALADHDVRWFEEPVSSDDLDGLRQVRDAVAVDIAAGEYGWSPDTYPALLTAVDCPQADVSRVGGITGWRRVAALTDAHHVHLSGHCAPHLHLDVAAATANLRHLEWFHDHVRIESLLFDGTTTPTGGALRWDPGAPGHGLTLRSADADRYRIA